MTKSHEIEDIKISAPIEKFYESLSQLSLEMQKEAFIYLKELIQKMENSSDKDFFSTEMGKYILKEADDSISIKEVRPEFSNIRVPQSKEADELREER